ALIRSAWFIPALSGIYIGILLYSIAPGQEVTQVQPRRSWPLARILTDASKSDSPLKSRYCVGGSQMKPKMLPEIAEDLRKDDCSVDWPMPEPLKGELPTVEPFSEELLPDSFRPFVIDVADRMQVPIDYPATVMMLSLAGAVNRRAKIQPKANDTSWQVIPNL